MENRKYRTLKVQNIKKNTISKKFQARIGSFKMQKKKSMKNIL